MTIEANFDGIVGPTHNYAGLAYGNLAAAANAGQASRPKEAALQGLAKAKAMADLGLVQGVLPPHERPHLPTLRALGFEGSADQMIAAAARDAPGLLDAVSSAAAMWTANAATVSASSDTRDGRVHLTPANLSSQLHRSIEAASTLAVLRATFRSSRFVHHDPLPHALGDEGAANHTRLGRLGEPGVDLFVHGDTSRSGRFRPRQHPDASRAVARRHGLDPARTVFGTQSPVAIDAGVFHNDVIAVGSELTLLHHEDAFDNTGALHTQLRSLLGDELDLVVVPAADVPLSAAVESYLFNSQLVRVADALVLIAPDDVNRIPAVAGFLSSLAGGPIRRVVTFDLRQSMRNGGGPACLRLRVPLTSDELAGVNPGSLLTPERFEALVAWVERHYREELDPSDLADPALYHESCRALDELTRLLGLGSVYDFQR